MGLADFILTYKGCPEPPSTYMCMGPIKQWFLMGLPLNQYPTMIIAALFLALFASAIIFQIKRKSLNVKKVVKIFIITFIVVFVLVYLFSISMQMNTVS
jgi:hypothetical protein